MISIIDTDAAFDGYRVHAYGYPTSRVQLPWNKASSGLQDLAQSLRTELEAKFPKTTDLTLAGHSLGGLVVRQYLMDTIKSGRTLVPSRAIVFAAPNNGSQWAAIGSKIQKQHAQVAQLRPDSDILRVLNEDWITFEVEEKIPFRYVIGLSDSIVSAQSARAYFRDDNTRTLPGEDHSSIVRPAAETDTKYIVLRNFALAAEVSQVEAVAADRSGNPLFDVYTSADERFYVVRELDRRLAADGAPTHLWISGPSGAGKTAALRRKALQDGFRLQHVMLAGYGSSAKVLFRAICVELAERLGTSSPPDRHAEIPELISFLVRCLTLDGHRCALVVEEIPLAPGAEYGELVTFVFQLSVALEIAGLGEGHTLLAFSSLHDPADDLRGGGRIRERVKFLKIDRWNEVELIKLVETLMTDLNVSLERTDVQLIADAAEGSPRFVKSLFRHWRNCTDDGLPLAALLQRVAAEQL